MFVLIEVIPLRKPYSRLTERVAAVTAYRAALSIEAHLNAFTQESLAQSEALLAQRRAISQ
jgi:N-acetylmuramoyl-L-alanine amidase